MRLPTKALLTMCAVSACVGAVAHAGDVPLKSELFVSGLSRPLFVTHAPGDFERVFIVEQPGRIKIVKNAELILEPFLDIISLVSCCGEKGLLGLAFHPDYAENGEFFVNYFSRSGRTVIARYRVSADPDVADPVGETLLSFSQPFPNHNGGWIDFGPDGYLYIASGDGGNQEDPGGRAQNTVQLLGKLLRIDVNGDDFPEDPDVNYAVPPDNPFAVGGGHPAVWAYGLRNPWRCAFDSQTGDLFIADVGQGEWEELNVQPASSTGGENYGWRCMEGRHCTALTGCSCFSPELVEPIHEYSHEVGCSITGGEVYRGCRVDGLQGTYFFADYCDGAMWSLRFDHDTGVHDFRLRTKELSSAEGLDVFTISSFGRDAYGELYICDIVLGKVFKIVPQSSGPVVDCNGNGAEDACDIRSGASADANVNLIPDECEPVAIIASDPPDGAIDARQPSRLDGTGREGWSFLEITVLGDANAMTPDDFVTSQQGGVLPPPAVSSVTVVGIGRLRVAFDRRIETGAWTTLKHVANPKGVRLGYLPADVNGDGVSNGADIVALVDVLNGIVTRPIYSTDLDRSTQAGAPDIVRAVDLLNGAAAYEAYINTSLP